MSEFKSSRPKIQDLAPGDFGAQLDAYEWVEMKYDGHFAEIHVHANGWVVYSRTGKVKMEGADKGLPKCHLIGEHIFGTQWAKAPEREHMYGDIVVFGGFEPDGSPMGFKKYRRLATELSRVIPIRLIKPMRMKLAARQWHGEVLASDWEGLVFKNRNGDIGRMKKRVTMDYVCMAIPESTSGSYKGWGARAIVGGLFVGGELVEKVSISGLTDEQRLDFLDREDELIGEVFEASGKTRFKSGALRHPSFERWRPDKPAAECTWEA